jgi:hypothetical protein
MKKWQKRALEIEIIGHTNILTGYRSEQRFVKIRDYLLIKQASLKPFDVFREISSIILRFCILLRVILNYK